MWEIREGRYGDHYGGRDSERYGSRYGERDAEHYGNRYYGNREGSKDYEEGFEDGYNKAMKEMGSMGERRDSRGRYM